MTNIKMSTALDLVKTVAILCTLVLATKTASSQERAEISSEKAANKLVEMVTTFKRDELSMIIDLWRIEVSRTPGSLGQVIIYCGQSCKYGEVEAHMRGILLALSSKKADTERIQIVFGGYREKTTVEFWVLNTPNPNPAKANIDPKNVKYKGRFSESIIHYECCY